MVGIRRVVAPRASSRVASSDAWWRVRVMRMRLWARASTIRILAPKDGRGFFSFVRLCREQNRSNGDAFEELETIHPQGNSQKSCCTNLILCYVLIIHL